MILQLTPSEVGHYFPKNKPQNGGTRIYIIVKQNTVKYQFLYIRAGTSIFFKGTKFHIRDNTVISHWYCLL